MLKTALRSLIVSVALGVVAFGAVTLNTRADSPWNACPQPPCSLACSIDPAPEVLCRAGGKPFVTSFACCCCGGGSASYKNL